MLFKNLSFWPRSSMGSASPKRPLVTARAGTQYASTVETGITST